MSISVFDLFKLGIGPSSSHTVGPMRAAFEFVSTLPDKITAAKLSGFRVDLYGSLALTGKGHGTDRAITLGLLGEQPHLIEPDMIEKKNQRVFDNQAITVAERSIKFNPCKDIVFHRRKFLPYHPNGMTISAKDANQNVISSETYYSIGGGFVVREADAKKDRLSENSVALKFPYKTCAELLHHCHQENLTIADIVLENEKYWHNETTVLAKLDDLWANMKSCISRGCQQEGNLPGKLKVKRRAKAIFQELTKKPEALLRDPLNIMDWVNLYALAVNEENAAGSRVVTAPTNGAAGIIPAVLSYYENFCQGADQKGVRTFLLTAAALGILYAQNASISGAEVGCQGEVGVACSMAAGGLVAALQGSPAKVEQAAEIGMEHNLGLTCDPIGGLVQIPCIERNAMGAVKAINAARIAMRGDGQHYVSLDSVMKTMMATGADMKTKYKETSRGGLAVNVIEC